MAMSVVAVVMKNDGRVMNNTTVGDTQSKTIVCNNVVVTVAATTVKI